MKSIVQISVGALIFLFGLTGLFIEPFYAILVILIGAALFFLGVKNKKNKKNNKKYNKSLPQTNSSLSWDKRQADPIHGNLDRD